jgi:signal transduction histidine kinase
MRTWAESTSGARAAAWVQALPIGRWDVALAAGLTVLAFIPGVSGLGTTMWDSPQRSLDGWASVLVLGLALPLAYRHRAPGLSLLVISAAFFGYQGLGYPSSIASLALYPALYTAGARQISHRKALIAVEILGYIGLAVCLEAQGSTNVFIEYVAFLVVPAGCWLVGVWARSRLRDQAERTEREQAAAMQAERDRIARELHDVVTHHVTAMVVQADATPYLLDGDRGRIEANLSMISDTGRRALGDLRELLQVLSPAHDEQRAPREPTAGKLHDLVEQTRSVGQPVELIESCSPDSPDQLDDGVDLTAYRVVQEALTNALKHAPGRRTVVELRSDGPEKMVVEVTTAGPGEGSQNILARGRPPVPSGRGLDGLRQRVAAVGGQLVAEAGPDGRFVVRATLPIGAGPNER